MAFVTYYIFELRNPLNELVRVEIQKKDGDEGFDVQEYNAASVKKKCNAQGDNKFAPIISTELEIVFNLQENDVDYWDELADASDDSFRVIATVDGVYVFHGFVIPDDGAVPFLDPPVQATIRANDRVGLLKQVPLTDVAGNKFDSEHLIIDYIAGAIKKTGLDLNIVVYDDLYHDFMQDRNAGLQYDFFNQAKLEYRTFQSDPVTFYDCYTVLEKILNRGYRIFYHNGEYIIYRLGLYQYVPFLLYYTRYNSEGTVTGGFVDAESYATIGRTSIIRPINKDAIQSTDFAMKSVKTEFEYVAWPEIPRNNKFERGTFIRSEELTNPVRTLEYYTVDDWDYGTYSGFPSQEDALPALTGTTATAYKLRTLDINLIEIDREIVLEEVTSGIRGMLICDVIPVVKGAKIKISFDSKLSYSGNGSRQVAMIFILPTGGGTKYVIESQNTSIMAPFYWKTATAGSFISKFYDTGENFNTYAQFEIDPPEIPVSGNLYIGFITPGVANSLSYYKNFSVEYNAQIAGGLVNTLADYWLRTQDKKYADKSEELIFLSDTPHKVFKGCILDNNGVPTSPQWHRQGISETRHFKELINIAEFNLLYRRFWDIEGTFRSTTYEPVNDQTNHQPIGFHKRYRFTDIPSENRQFILVCPFEMDYTTGQFRGEFMEVLKATTEYVEEIESFDRFRGRIVNALNNTTEAEWDSAGNAPSVQTGFPPIAYVYPDTGWVLGEPRSIGVIINPDDEMTVSGPGIVEFYNEITGDGYRQMIFKFDSETLTVGDQYTFSAYGHNVIVTVGTVQIADQDDGKILGDSAEFKYKFK